MNPPKVSGFQAHEVGIHLTGSQVSQQLHGGGGTSLSGGEVAVNLQKGMGFEDTLSIPFLRSGLEEHSNHSRPWIHAVVKVGLDMAMHLRCQRHQRLNCQGLPSGESLDW